MERPSVIMFIHLHGIEVEPANNNTMKDHYRHEFIPRNFSICHLWVAIVTFLHGHCPSGWIRVPLLPDAIDLGYPSHSARSAARLFFYFQLQWVQAISRIIISYPQVNRDEVSYPRTQRRCPSRGSNPGPCGPKPDVLTARPRRPLGYLYPHTTN